MFPSIAPETPGGKHYWQLITKDGREFTIPPSAVAVIQRKMAAKEPLTLDAGSIPFSEIKGFYPTAKKAVTVPLLEETARAFGDPMIIENEDGTQSIKARWVKKEVTASEFNNYYGKHPSYQKLGGGSDGIVTVAFVVAAHDVDPERVEYCTREEITKLTK